MNNQRIAAALGLGERLALDRFVPGVRDLLAGLSEERARYFVESLTSVSGHDRAVAEQRLQDAAATTSGSALVASIVKECVFGTERLSLAALAVLVSEASRDPSDPFPAFGIRALDGLADLDSNTFLALLSRPDLSRPVPSRWRPYFRIDAAQADSESWRDVRALLGVGQESLFLAVHDLLRRRVLLPDTGSGRVGGDDDRATVVFGLGDHGHRFYELLYTALRIVDLELLRALSIMSPEEVRRSTHWQPSGTAADT